MKAATRKKVSAGRRCSEMYPAVNAPAMIGRALITFQITLKRPDMSCSWPTRAVNP